MSALGSLVASIRLEHAQYTAGLAKADQETLQKAQSIQRSLDGLTRAAEQSDERMAASMQRAADVADRSRNLLANFARTAVAAFSVGQIIRTADEYGQLQSRLEGATRSHAEYVAVQERLLEISGRVYRGLGESVEMFTRTAESLRQVGFSSQDAADLVATLNYALTVNSASAEKTASLVNAFSTAILTGKMGLDQFNSVISASPRLQQAMADALGTNNAGLMEMVRTGGLSVEQLMRVTSQMEAVGSEADKMKTSVGDALTNAGTQFGVWINHLNDASGATDALVAGIDLVVSNLNDIAMVGALTAGPLLVKQFGAMAGAALTSAGAVARDTLAQISNTAASVQKARVAALVAQEDHARAIAALAVARAEFEAARGTGAHAFALEALMRAQTRANVTAAAAAGAQSGLAVALRATLGFLGGPAGLITLGATAAAGWLLFRDNTTQAANSLVDLQGPMDEVIAKFRQLNALQREQVVNQLGADVADAAKEVAAAQRELEKAFYPGTEGGARGAQARRNAFNEELRAIVQDANRTSDEAAEAVLRLIDAHLKAAGGTEKHRTIMIALASTLDENLAKLRRNENQLDAVSKAQAEAAATAGQLGDGLRGIAAGMAQPDWDKYLRELTNARDVIGMTARELSAFQAIGKGANEEQAALAGIIGAQSDEYRNLQKAIQDKDTKASEGARKRLQELAEEEAKVQSLLARTAVLAKAQALVSQGASMTDVTRQADEAAASAYQRALDQVNEQIRRLDSNTVAASNRRTRSQSESEGAKLLKSINERIDALKVEALAYGEVSKAQQELMEFEQRLTRTKDASLKKHAEEIRLGYMLADMQETANKRAATGRQLQQQYVDGILDQNASLYESYFRLHDQVSTWAADEEQAARNLEALEQSRVRERIATEEQTLARLQLQAASADEIRTSQEALAALNSQLEVRQKLAWLNETAQDQAKQRQAIQAQVQQWGQMIDGLRDTFQEGFFAALGDQDAVSAFGDNLKRSAKTALASAAYEAFAKPIIVRFVAQLAGLVGGPAVQQGILQQAGLGGGNITSLLSGVNTLTRGVNTVAGWLGLGGSAVAATGLGTASAAAGLGITGSMLGTGTATGIGLGINGAAAGIGLQAGGATLATTAGTSAAGAAGAAGIMGTIGAAAPYIAAAAMAYSLLKDSFKGETRYGAGYMIDPATGRAVHTGGPSGGDSSAAASIDAIRNTYAATADLARRLGGSIDALSYGAGSELSPEKGRSFVWSSWGRTPEEVSHITGMRDLAGVTEGSVVAQEFAVELQRSIIRGLQMSNVDQHWAEWLDQIDVGRLDEASVQGVLATIDALVQLRDAATAMGMQSLADASAAAQANIIGLSGGIEAFSSNLSTYYQLFYSEAERTAHLQEQLTGTLAELGYELPRTHAGFRGIIESLDLSTAAGQEAYATLIGVAGAFDQLVTSLDGVGETLDTAFADQLEIVRSLSAETNRLLGLRNRAGSTLDQIDRALGRTGIFAAAREAELSAALATASYEQQVQLVSELTPMVLDRIQAEMDAAQTLRDFSRSTADYLKSLVLGDLSPLTMGERLGEAARQYADLLAKAQAGDTDAMNQLQGAADAYLQLARDYYASSDAYTAIFGYVTSSLESMGVQAETDAQRALSVNESSLAELESLRAVAERAYGALDRQYTTSLQALQSETALLTSIGADTGRLHDIAGILAGLPAEIAARLQPLLGGAAAGVVGGWYADAGFSDPAGQDYWAGQLQQRPGDQVRQDYLEALVGNWYRDYLGHEPDAGGWSYWVGKANELGASKTFEHWAHSAGIPGYARGGLASGMSLVGERGPELIDFATPSRVYTHNQLTSAISSGQSAGDIDRLVMRLDAGMQALRQELTKLREERSRGDQLQAEAVAVAAKANADDIVGGLGEMASRRDWEQSNSRYSTTR